MNDGEADVETYNSELARLKEKGKGTWFSAPWLYAEYVECLPYSFTFI